MTYGYIQVVPSGRAQANYDFQATNDEELTIAENDILEVLDTDDPEWMLVQHNEQIGFVPASYVQLVSEYENILNSIRQLLTMRSSVVE
jgi:hypothetical protein